MMDSWDHLILLEQACDLVDLNDERSMDLLLGLLVHTGWCHYRYQTVHTQMYLCLQLAITLVVDLGLDQISGFTMRSIVAEVKGKDGQAGDDQSGTAKRALLGVFHISSA